MPSDDPAASTPSLRRASGADPLLNSAREIAGGGNGDGAGAGADLRIALTTGEPAGIGPEVTVSALLAHADVLRAARCSVHVLGDPALLAERAALIGVAQDWQQLLAAQDSPVRVLPQELDAPCIAGTLNPSNGAYVLRLLDAAIDGCLGGEFGAMVTAPLQKSTINEGCVGTGKKFTGHTEYLAERTGTPQVVMMLAGPQQARGGEWLRVALATTHLPLAAVPAAITGPLLSEVLRIIDHDLRHHFGIAAPRILVTGLNPHAGEGGHLGREEIEVIGPALERARTAGIDARGPYPADTLFQPRHLQHADCVLAMYHDQGLAPLKYATFGEGVNITLGLPLIRTSVDHGTALDLAGTGRANHGSLLQAIEVAMQMAQARTPQF